MNPNATPTPTPNTIDSNAAADSATAHEPEGFAEFRRESLGLFGTLEELASSWGLQVAIRTFDDLGLRPENASGLFMPAETARQFAGIPDGVGVAVVRLESATDLPGFYWGEFIQSVLCHEIAHCAVCQLERLQGQRPVMIPRALMSSTLSMSQVEVDRVFAENGAAPWTGHESQFLRACCHIRRRLMAAGLDTNESWILPSQYYQLSPLSWYRSLIGSEAADRQGLPLTEAIAGPAPAEFTELFAADVLRWQERQQQRRQQPTTTRDNTHGRENSQTRENSEAQGPPGRLKPETISPKRLKT